MIYVHVTMYFEQVVFWLCYCCVRPACATTARVAFSLPFSTRGITVRRLNEQEWMTGSGSQERMYKSENSGL